MILGSDIMNEIIKTYLYSNNYFLMVRYTGNEIDNNIISRELDNKYSRKIELSTFDILSLIEGISSNIKDLKITIVYNDDVVSILEMLLPNNKTKKYVKMVMGLYILFSIISPFIKNSDKLNFENIDVSSYINEELDTSNVEVNQESMDKRLKEIYIEELENDITKKLKEKGYTIEYCKVDANISQENNDSGIKKINLKLDKKEETKTDENSKTNENTTETIENKIVSEIQKIQKVEVKVGNNTKENSTEKENSKITKTDIESVKEFLISEYGVSKSCLKIN